MVNPVGGVLLLQKWTNPGPPLAASSVWSNPSAVSTWSNASRPHYTDAEVPGNRSIILPLRLNGTAALPDYQLPPNRPSVNGTLVTDNFIGNRLPTIMSYEANREELTSALVLNLSIFGIGIIIWILWQLYSNAQKGLQAGRTRARASDAGGSQPENAEETSVLGSSLAAADQTGDPGEQNPIVPNFENLHLLESDAHKQMAEGSLGKRNYLSYLLICCYTCLTLSFVNWLFLLPHGLVSKILFGGWSIFMVLGEIDIWEIYALTIIDGLIVFFFSEFYRQLIEVPEIDPAHERMRRSVWMQGLPTHDTMRWWKPFELNSKEIRTVGHDLVDALTEFLRDPSPDTDTNSGSFFGKKKSSDTPPDSPEKSTDKEVSSDSLPEITLPSGPPPLNLKSTQWRCQLENGNPYYVNVATKVAQWDLPAELQPDIVRKESPVVEEIQVAEVVDTWQEIHAELQEAQEYLVAYEANADRTKKALSTPEVPFFRNCFLSLAGRYYEQQIKTLRPRIAKLQRDLTKMKQDKRMISGSAFVTFKRAMYRDRILQWYKYDETARLGWRAIWRQSYTYFTFGRPPFASVTLSCESAPHPSDVHWSNLHVRPVQRHVVFWSLSILFMLVMIFMVTAVRISEFLLPMIGFLRKELDELEKMRVWDRNVPDWTKSEIKKMNNDYFWAALFEQVPTVVLLFINSIIVPQAILGISTAERSALYSDAEIRRMLVNFVFLFNTTVVVPFCNVASMSELVSMIADALGESDKPAEHLQNLIMSMPGVFALKYLMNATFLTNINQLLQIPQKSSRYLFVNFFAVTDRDVKMYQTPWIFYWGYWYAWTLSIFSLGLMMSVACPSTLPVAALFFFIKYRVDQHNLENGVYTCGTDMEGSLAVRVVSYLRMIVGIWWFTMGLLSYVLHYFEVAEGLVRQEKEYLRRGGIFFMVLGSVAMLVAQWLKAENLHVIQLHGIGRLKTNLQSFSEDNWWVWFAVTLGLLHPKPAGERTSTTGSDKNLPTPGPWREQRRKGSLKPSATIVWDGPRILGLEPPRKTRLALPSPRTEDAGQPSSSRRSSAPTSIPG